MDKLITALAPVFAAGFAVQQFLEIPGTLIDVIERAQKYKKIILGIIGAVIGCSLAWWSEDLRVLKILLTHTVTDAAGKATTVVPNINSYVEIPVTGLIISAGTEGVNSILKFLKYSKEDKKNAAAASDPESPTGGEPAKSTAAKPSSKALQNMNLK